MPTAPPTDIHDLADLRSALSELRQRLCAHAMLTDVLNLEELRVLMEHHVFAVWDYMSLLRAVQRNVVGCALPWRPSPDPAARRLINEIVLDEESDLLPDHLAPGSNPGSNPGSDPGIATGTAPVSSDPSASGVVADAAVIDLARCTSHFELYLRAMEQAGADTLPIRTFLALIDDGQPVEEALVSCEAPASSRRFVIKTWNLIESGSTVELVAAFALGREELIPDMFGELIDEIARSDDADRADLSLFRHYLNRHLQGGRHRSRDHAPGTAPETAPGTAPEMAPAVASSMAPEAADSEAPGSASGGASGIAFGETSRGASGGASGDGVALRSRPDRAVWIDHGPRAVALLESLCMHEADWQTAYHAARQALTARLALWDGIHAAIQTAEHRLAMQA